MSTFNKNKKIVDDYHGSRVEMIANDGWAEVGWTGVVIDSNDTVATVRWDNGKRLGHMKGHLRIMSVTEGDNPNTVFRMRKFSKRINKNV